MTECTTDGISCGRQGRRRIEANFDGGRLTTDAGLLLLRQVDRRLGWSDKLAGCLTDPRDPAKIEHDLQALLLQRIGAIACGYEDLNDHQSLRHDPGLQLAAGVEPSEDRPLASPSTLCRLEHRVTRQDCVRLQAAMVDQFIASHDASPATLVLDFDATDDPLHGRQEGRFFHGYYDHYCYLPLYVFCGDELLVAYLRPSNIDPSKHARAVLKLLVDQLRRAWPAVQIIVRGDSGFCRWKLMRWCDRHQVDYVLGLSRNPVLERISEPFMAQSEADFEQTDQKQRQFHEIQYAAATWDRPRRVIVKAERLPQGPNVRFIVTSLDGDPQTLYDDRYCQRGEMENRIKEQQLMLFADRTSCRTMLANQFRLLLSSAAYVLMQAMRRVALPGTDLARAQVSTIRLKLLKLAARVTVSARRVVFHLASGYPMQALFRLVAARLTPVCLDSS